MINVDWEPLVLFLSQRRSMLPGTAQRVAFNCYEINISDMVFSISCHLYTVEQLFNMNRLLQP